MNDHDKHNRWRLQHIRKHLPGALQVARDNARTCGDGADGESISLVCEAAELLLTRVSELENAPCVTRLVPHTGKAVCAYLRDGTKIRVCRERCTIGPAWLEHQKQATIGLASPTETPDASKEKE